MRNSELLPALDLDWLLEFVEADDQTGAVKRWREALRAGKSKKRGRSSH